MLEKVSFRCKGKKFDFLAKKCNPLQEVIGLMFKRREKAEPLLFDFKEPVDLKIHSFFVFFSFLSVWIDNKGKVIEIKKVSPFSLPLRPKRPYRKLLEVPFNRKNYKKVKLLVGN